MTEAAEKKPSWQERSTQPNIQVESGVRARVRDVTPPLEGLRVLWMDADLACTADCRAMLESWGAVIVVVEDPAAGLDAAAATCPDAVVISFDRGAHSPDQLARILHYVIPTPPPVILVTKRDMRGYDGALPGVVRLMPKPVHPRAMLDALKKIEPTG